MIVLGLDLSIAKTGACLIDSYINQTTIGLIQTKPRDCLEKRLREIRDGIKGFAGGHAAFTDIAVIEEPIQHSQHKSGQMNLHALYGVVRLLLYEHNVKIEWVHPKTLKKATTGNGNASKDAMVRAVKMRWGIEAQDDNEADAVALAMYGTEKAREWASLEI